MPKDETTRVPATVAVIDPLLGQEGADALLRLAEQHPGYGLYVVETSDTELAPELPQRVDAGRNYVLTGGRFGRDEPVATLLARTNYLRETYAYGEEILAPGIEGVRDHPALAEAAAALHGRPVVEPAIVYANILLAGQELTVHTDVPEFRGANRKVIPQWLLVVMRHSGLFERWRMPIATAISYFAPEGRSPVGGELAYFPDGSDGAPVTHAATHDTAVVLDTDTVFHGVDLVGPPDGDPPPVEPSMVLRYEGGSAGAHDGRWVLRDDAGPDAVAVDTYGWEDLRLSISWKAYCFEDEAERESWRTHADDLTLEDVLGTLRGDLDDRGVLARDAEIADADLALLLIDTYERFPAPTPS